MFVVDPATDEETYVADGVYPVWVDDHSSSCGPIDARTWKLARGYPGHNSVRVPVACLRSSSTINALIVEGLRQDANRSTQWGP